MTQKHPLSYQLEDKNSRENLSARFLASYGGRVRPYGSGVDSSVYEIEGALHHTLLKVFDQLQINCDSHGLKGLDPKQVLDWYFAQMKLSAEYVRENPNPLGHTAIVDGEKFAVCYEVSAPGALIQGDEVWAARIEDVREKDTVYVPDIWSENFKAQVNEMYRYLLALPEHFRITPEQNVCIEINQETQELKIIFTDLGESIYGLYVAKKDLLSRLISILSKRTRQRVAAFT